MRPIAVDFAPRRVWTPPLIAWAIACGLVTTGLSLKAGLAWDARQAASRSVEESQARLSTLEKKLREASQSVTTQKAPAYSRDALETARVAGFPSQAVLRSLEATAEDGIRINSVSLQPAQGIAEVALEFADYEALLRYIDQLNEGSPRALWSLVRAQSLAGKKLAVIRYTAAR
ncbi:hypothetical protein [Roseateles terrae]|uniref:Type II secretion system protein M n=1 Tax=Roseateles terrae TaxID=431060 RepID=A0ABR6GP37_9BURK|nr:hypothetical protein [Roseateles terrae]MBB3193880.1 hypothetical protein [Roseateles terrae]OWQ87765.1 hypothetical protein CDN98_06245 [Roseateles terrae]